MQKILKYTWPIEHAAEHGNTNTGHYDNKRDVYFISWAIQSSQKERLLKKQFWFVLSDIEVIGGSYLPY